MKKLLKELFEQYYKDIYIYLYRLSHDASLADDLTSEVFLEVVKSITTFRGESDIKTWLFSIARHRWCAYLKHKRKRIATESIHELYDSNFVGLQEDSFNEAEQLMQHFLANEPQINQAVFRRRLEGYSYYEIAAELQISESSASVLFFRMKTQLKQIFEKEGVLP